MAATVVVKAKSRPAYSDPHRGGDAVWGGPGDAATNAGGNDTDCLDGGSDTDTCIRGDTITGYEVSHGTR